MEPYPMSMSLLLLASLLSHGRISSQEAGLESDGKRTRRRI